MAWTSSTGERKVIFESVCLLVGEGMCLGKREDRAGWMDGSAG